MLMGGHPWTVQRWESLYHKRTMQQFITHLQQTISTTTTLEDINSLRDVATTMYTWKLASFLRQSGVGCLRCAKFVILLINGR